MRYMGSKQRLSKYLVPIIQNEINKHGSMYYIEPFVGGANIIDKIQCQNKIGYDINKYLIALLQQAQKDVSVFPEKITEEEYYYVKSHKDDFPDWYIGLVGFCASFSSQFFMGFGRNGEKSKGDYSTGSINNIIKQAPNLKNIHFETKNYLDIDNIVGCTIYCDPPYFSKSSTKYRYLGTEKLDEKVFWNWCRKIGKNNNVLISNYEAPNDFQCIFEKERKNAQHNAGELLVKERLYIYE